MSNNIEALIANAKHQSQIMEYISSFESQDIDGDDVELRFEIDGLDTGCDVSIVEQCGESAAIIDALIAALEREISIREQNLSIKLHMAARIAELEARPLCVKLPNIPNVGSDTEWYQGFIKGAEGMRNECAMAIRAAGGTVESE